MEITSNYVLVDGIKTEDGRLIPIWDKEIVYVKNKKGTGGAFQVFINLYGL